MGVNLCVTTLNRQDALVECLRSACAGTMKPDAIFIVDQANRPDLLAPAIDGLPCFVATINLGHHVRGCEASAINWYLMSVPEERVIAHDDVVFGPDSLERFLTTDGAFVIDASQGVLTYRDHCKNMAGLYDETISPGFYRYCDVDYEDRLAWYGIQPVVVDCGIEHKPNGTMRAYTPEQHAEYYRRVEIARFNYELKWLRPLTPGGDTIGRAEWRKNHEPYSRER